jgi:hypothetical protein
MATNSLIIKDGNGAISRLSANSSSTGLIPEHTISGSVTVTSSLSNPIYVTGTVTVSQPVNVDLVLNDTLTASVTLSAVNSGFTEGAGVGKTALLVYLTGSSGNKINIDGVTPIDGKLQITSSAASPIYTTGTTDIGISKYGYSGGQALIVKTTSSVVTLDGINTIFSNIGTPTTGVAVGLIGQENLVKLYNSTSSVTSSQTNPLYVTGITTVTASYTNPVYITGTVLIDNTNNGLRHFLEVAQV